MISVKAGALLSVKREAVGVAAPSDRITKVHTFSFNQQKVTIVLSLLDTESSVLLLFGRVKIVLEKLVWLVCWNLYKSL